MVLLCLDRFLSQENLMRKIQIGVITIIQTHRMTEKDSLSCSFEDSFILNPGMSLMKETMQKMLSRPPVIEKKEKDIRSGNVLQIRRQQKIFWHVTFVENVEMYVVEEDKCTKIESCLAPGDIITMTGAAHLMERNSDDRRVLIILWKEADLWETVLFQGSIGTSLICAPAKDVEQVLARRLSQNKN